MDVWPIFWGVPWSESHPGLQNTKNSWAFERALKNLSFDFLNKNFTSKVKKLCRFEKELENLHPPDKPFFTELKQCAICLCLIITLWWIDLEMSAWCHFVKDKLYFYFFISFLMFPLVKCTFCYKKEEKIIIESLWFGVGGGPHFKMSPFLNKKSYKFLLGLDLKNFRISFRRSLIFYDSLKSKQ